MIKKTPLLEYESATRDGNAEPWRVESVGNGKRIFLGSAAVTLPHGEHTYEIVYRTDRQMGYFAEHDEHDRHPAQERAGAVASAGDSLVAAGDATLRSPGCACG